MSSQKCHILLINLASSTERLAHCKRELKAQGLSFERIEAIDGRKLPPEELAEVHPSESNGYFKQLKPAEIGCYLSHVRAMQRMVELNLDHALIMEDDFVLAANFAERLEAVVAAIEQDHDQIRLEGEQPLFLVEKELRGGDRLVRYKHPLTRALAILWTRRGALKFLQIAHPIRRPVDVQFKHWWEGDLQVSYVQPELVSVHEPNAASSTIGNRQTRGLPTRLRRLGYSLSFTLKSHICQLSSLGLARMARLRLGLIPSTPRRGLILPS